MKKDQISGASHDPLAEQHENIKHHYVTHFDSRKISTLCCLCVAFREEQQRSAGNLISQYRTTFFLLVNGFSLLLLLAVVVVLIV
jgi:hypothetical protein